MIPDTSGPASLVPLAHYDPDSSSWRTSGVMFPSDWPTSSETCPAWGMTRGGELFELPTPAPPTNARDCSSSLLPTPVADHSRGLPSATTAFGSLPNAVVALLPTPVASDSHGVPSAERSRERAKERALPLSEAVQLLPTPLASDGEHGGPNQRGGSGDLRLSSAVHLLPTPTAMDSHGSRGYRPDGTPYTATAGVTLTDAALASSGAHTAPQSPAGSPPSDDQLPGQLSLVEAAND